MDSTACHICGKDISKEDLSLEHVPPKAFYPNNIRDGLNLWTVPAHKSCNESYRKDEEYFQHSLLIEVLNQNPSIKNSLATDFKRRAAKPQTPAMFRRIQKEISNVTPGGIHLPPRVYVVQIDLLRVEKVVLKIVQGLFYLQNCNYLPLECVKDFRFCLSEKEVPELYRLSWQVSRLQGVYPPVFSYKYFYHESFKFQLFSMLFWESVMFCLAIEST